MPRSAPRRRQRYAVIRPCDTSLDGYEWLNLYSHQWEKPAMLARPTVEAHTTMKLEKAEKLARRWGALVAEVWSTVTLDHESVRPPAPVDTPEGVSE